MKVRRTKPFVFERIENILIRGTNWIGDAVMTLPAVAAVRETFPRAKITVLCKPWVAALYETSPDIDEIFLFETPGRHDGVAGKVRLARDLKKKKFDLAILLQNAIEAAIITYLARIPLRAGYNSDGRGLLLTHSVQRTRAIRKVHQVHYYLEMLASLGFRSAGPEIEVTLGKDYHDTAGRIFDGCGVAEDELIVGMAPGASYGPAKMWYPERYAAVADKLADDFGARIALFGSKSDRDRTDLVQQYAAHECLNVAGKTSLRDAIALIARCDLFISNDSGLMHLAGALGIPLVAIFGSTNPATTSPVGKKSVVVHKDVSCSPCLKQVCPSDFRCMDIIETDDIYQVAKRLLAETQNLKDVTSSSASG
jgi:heptosyltransferase-2